MSVSNLSKTEQDTPDQAVESVVESPPPASEKRNIFLNRERKRNDNLESQIGDISEEISFVDDQIAEMQYKLQTVNQTIQEIQEAKEIQQQNQIQMSTHILSVDFEIKRSATLKQTLKELQDQITEAKELIELSTEQIKFVENEHSKVRNHKSQLFEKLNQLQKESIELSKKQAALEDLSPFDRKISMARGENDQIKIRSNRIMEVIEYKKNLLTKLQNDLEKRRADAHEADEDIKELEEQYNKYDEESKTLFKSYKTRDTQRQAIRAKIEAENLPLQDVQSEAMDLEYSAGKLETRLKIATTEAEIARMRTELSQKIANRYQEHESEKLKHAKDEKQRESYESIIATLDRRYTLLERAAAARRAQLELEHQQYLMERHELENEVDNRARILREQLRQGDLGGMVQRVDENKKKIEEIKAANERRKENLKAILNVPGLDSMTLMNKEAKFKGELEAADILRQKEATRKLQLDKREAELTMQEEYIQQERESLKQRRKLVELKTLENKKMIDMYKKLGH